MQRVSPKGLWGSRNKRRIDTGKGGPAIRKSRKTAPYTGGGGDTSIPFREGGQKKKNVSRTGGGPSYSAVQGGELEKKASAGGVHGRSGFKYPGVHDQWRK